MSSTSFEAIRRNLEYDPAGGLSLNGQAMILLPRHFFVYLMEQVEAVAGADAYRRIFRRAGYDGALAFCRRFREVHGCTGRQAVEGYLAEMSLRGWGRYEIVRLDEEEPFLEVLLRDSALGAARVQAPRHEAWAGAMEGAMAFLVESRGARVRLAGGEVAPAPGDPEGACRIRVRAEEEEA